MQILVFSCQSNPNPSHIHSSVNQTKKPSLTIIIVKPSFHLQQKKIRTQNKSPDHSPRIMTTKDHPQKTSGTTPDTTKADASELKNIIH